MQISDAIPIQFWVNGQQSFNEAQECGMTQVCFCQPFNCDDEITIQFQDDEYTGYELLIYNKNNSLLSSLPFNEVSDGLWQLTFIPSDVSPSIFETVLFKIHSFETVINDSDFLTGWSNGASGLDWTFGSDATITLPGVESKIAQKTYSILENQVYRVTIPFNFTNVGTPQLIVYLNYGSYQINIGTFNTEGSYQIDYEFTALENSNYIGFSFDEQSDESSITVESFQLDELIEIATSDCIDIRNDHECTKLISYTNSCDFGNSSNFISYETSPQPTFYLRVPMRIIDEENPQEQEDIELSDGRIISLRQSIQFKDLFEIGYLPNYMHRKIQLALMHETVTIEGQQYIRRDSYESSRIDNYPLKKATVLLTKYNSVIKNTI